MLYLCTPLTTDITVRKNIIHFLNYEISQRPIRAENTFRLHWLTSMLLVTQCANFMLQLPREKLPLIEAYYDESENNQQKYYVMIGA